MSKHRIKLLDSFRCLAILPVMLIHFTNPIIVAVSPFGLYDHVFRYGYLGVQFFYMISGFVISYTLEHTQSAATFWRNRFARLFPPMLLCSLITFLVVTLFDHQHLFPNAHEPGNLLPGLTFINPQIWSMVSGTKFKWINGSYWSLWVEVQFYIVASAVYFFNKTYFIRNLVLTGLLVCIYKYIPIYLLNNYLNQQPAPPPIFHIIFEGWRQGNEIFNITFFIIWFLPGVIFYKLFKGVKLRGNLYLPVCSVLILFLLVYDTHEFFPINFYQTLGAALLMIFLFMLMIYRPHYLAFMENRVMMRIGVISYTIYLVHEVIGGMLIKKYAQYVNTGNFLFTIAVIMLAIAFANLSYRFYEVKLNKFLKKNFSKAAEAVNP